MTSLRFTMEEIAKRKGHIHRIIIEHDQLVMVEEELEMRILAGAGMEAARLSMLVAPSGCGKTTTVKQAKSRLECRNDIALESLQPILYCSLPARCSIKTMTTALLHSLRDPLAERTSTIGMNSIRIIGQLRSQQVRLLILDEFQHLISPSPNATHKEATDWLKEVLDGAGVPVVCVGMPESLSVIATHDQIRRRTAKVIRMRPFAWDDGGEETSRFRSFLHIFEKELCLGQPSGLATREFAERIHIASGGLIGVVAQLIAEAVEISMKRSSGPDCLTVADFGAAYAGLPFEGANPFQSGVNLQDLRARLSAAAEQSGAAFSGDGLLAVNMRGSRRTPDNRHA